MSESRAAVDSAVIVYDGPSGAAMADAIVAVLPGAQAIAITADGSLDDTAKSALAGATCIIDTTLGAASSKQAVMQALDAAAPPSVPILANALTHSTTE